MSDEKKTGQGMTHVLEEDLEDAASLLVDETRDTLDTTSSSKPTRYAAASG